MLPRPQARDGIQRARTHTHTPRATRGHKSVAALVSKNPQNCPHIIARVRVAGRGSASEGTQADKQTERRQASKQREFAWRELDVAPGNLPGFFAMVKHQPEKDDIHLVHLGANQKGVLRNLVTAEFHFLR